jgi:hypothetical protein
MSTETNAAPTETKPKTPRKRARKPSAVTNDFLSQKRAEMTAKAKELDAGVKSLEKDYDNAKQGLNAILDALQKCTSERDRVVAGLAAIDKAVSMKAKAS